MQEVFFPFPKSISRLPKSIPVCLPQLEFIPIFPITHPKNYSFPFFLSRFSLRMKYGLRTLSCEDQIRLWLLAASYLILALRSSFHNAAFQTPVFARISAPWSDIGNITFVIMVSVTDKVILRGKKTFQQHWAGSIYKYKLHRMPPKTLGDLEVSGCSLNIVFFSKNSRKLATSLSLASNWLLLVIQKIPANMSDCTLALR